MIPKTPNNLNPFYCSNGIPVSKWTTPDTLSTPNTPDAHTTRLLSPHELLAHIALSVLSFKVSFTDKAFLTMQVHSSYAPLSPHLCLS